MNNRIRFCSIVLKSIFSLILVFGLIFSPLSSHAAFTLSSPVENLSQLRLQDQQVCYEDICLSYDSSIATNVITGKSPEQDLGFSYISENVNFRFEGYPLTNDWTEPVIYIMPLNKASRFSMEIDLLRSTLADRPEPSGIFPPLIPWINAGYHLVAKMSYLEFASGSGIRFVANLGQDVSPHTVDGMFYSFQGLSNDGQYYIAARLPISVNFTAAATPSVDSSFEEIISYNQELSAQVGQVPDHEYFPSITTLDAIIQSLTIGVPPLSPIQQPGSTLCGQAKFVTSTTGPSFFPVLVQCGSDNIFLWQSPTFKENAYYQIFDPVIETIPPRDVPGYNKPITQSITGWTSFQEISSCEVCGLGPPLISSPLDGSTDLQLTKVDIDGTPTAFKPFGLTLTVQNSGFARYQPNTGNYQVKIEFIEDFPYQKTLLVFDSETDGIDRWLSPQQLPQLEPCADAIDQLCGEVQITISDLLYPATYTGSLHVTFVPKDGDTNAQNNTWSNHFPVGASDQSYRHCMGLALKFLPDEGLMLADPRLTPEFLEMTLRVSNCPDGNEACVANESGQFFESVIEKKLLQQIGKATPIGRIKTTIEALLEGGKCTTWCWNYFRLLNDRLRKSNIGFNIAVVESPAFIMIQNQAGQQTGFDDQGSVVQNIPESYAFTVNDDKVIIYPPDPQTSIRLKGTDTGVMNVRLIWVDYDQPTKAVFYEGIPVTASTIATIDGTDSQFTLNVDQDEDGQNDAVFLPSITNDQAGNFLNSRNWLAFVGVGLLLLGTFMFFRLSLKK